MALQQVLGVLRTALAIALLSAIVGCATELTAPNFAVKDFCLDPRIVAEAKRQDPKLEPSPPWCQASRIAFRRDDVVAEVAVASVLRGYAYSYDVGWGVMESIVRLPDDRLINLGRKAPVPILNESGLAAVMNSLDINADMRAAVALKQFYTAVLQLTKRGYCVTYEMMPPFAGGVSQCAGDVTFYGEASYMPGTTTWEQASVIACEVAEERAYPCDIAEQKLITDEGGKPVYLIQVVHNLPEGSKFAYERLYYFIDLATGAATLRGRSMPNEPRLLPSELLKAS